MNAAYRLLSAVATAGPAGTPGPPGPQLPPSIASLGASLPAWSALPLAGLLLSVAVLPAAAPRLWHRAYPVIVAGWSLLLILPLLAIHGGSAAGALATAAIDGYLPFVILLGCLFIVGGGIHLRATWRGTPLANTALLATGALLAAVAGTTAAAVILIRPLLRTNLGRRHRTHTVVFFIFLVANLGGVLTPLGDPPLFLGFLHGVPFFWTLTLLPELLLAGTMLLAAYLATDLLLWRRDRPAAAPRPAPQAIHLPRAWIAGAPNLALLAGALAAVLASALWPGPEVPLLGASVPLGSLVRDAVLLVLTAVSWTVTDHRVRQANDFSLRPMKEVAVLFAGIFATLVPVEAMLRAGAMGPLGGLTAAVDSPHRLFWIAGSLSSVLDNAPTYLTFLSAVLGRFHPTLGEHEAIGRLILDHPAHLRALSTGAVFFGAATYLGNAPNLMVRAIAEQAGVPMPSLPAYVLTYSLPVLLPVLALTAWCFY